MAADVEEEMQGRKNKLLMDEIDKFVNGYNVNSQPKSMTWM